MFCGKSEELIRRIRRAEIAQQHTQVFTHTRDNRYGVGVIASHNGLKRDAVPVKSAEQVLELLDPQAVVIAVDEGQFFNATLKETAHALSDRGLRVIVAGLDMDFRGEPFGPMGIMMAIATKVDKLTAVCAVCKGEATMTQRLVNGKPAHYSDDIVLVGATEAYQARCPDCHLVLLDSGDLPLFEGM
jgi:thymidine kinase